MSPVVGLYAAPAALILYAAFGSSRHLVTGPMAATAALSAAAVGDLATSGSDAFLQLTVTLGIVTGILAVVAGLLRLGFLANFISEPVLKGFIIGLALTIIVGQLPKLFGIEKGSGNFFEQAWDFLTKLGDTSGLTLLVGVLSLAIVLGLREYARVVPGSLAAVLLGILAVKLFDLDHDGVAIVGSIDSGLPALGLFVLLLYRASRPHVAVLGRVPGSDEAYADVERRPEKETIPGIVILRVESGLFFGNAEPVRKAVRRHAAESGTRVVVLDGETVPFVDVPAATMLLELAADLKREGVELVMARDVGQVRDVLSRLDSGEQPLRIFPTVHDAVAALSAEAPRRKP